MILYLSRGTPSRPRWCILRSAIPGGLITVACGSFEYRTAAFATQIPAEHVCPACWAATSEES